MSESEEHEISREHIQLTREEHTTAASSMLGEKPKSKIRRHKRRRKRRRRRPRQSEEEPLIEAVRIGEEEEETPPEIVSSKRGRHWLVEKICGSCLPKIEEEKERVVVFVPHETAETTPSSFPQNVIRNQKYSIFSFIPVFLYEQFRYFFNLYFLVVTLTQFIPMLQVGFLFTYVAPLAFVLGVSMLKEGYEDLQRFRRDKRANGEVFQRVIPSGVPSEDSPNNSCVDVATELVASSQLTVGDIVVLETDQRVPADMILLRTKDKTGTIFIRTDQLDGETDWKLRRAIHSCQRLPSDEDLVRLRARVVLEPPRKEIYDFAGAFTFKGTGDGRKEVVFGQLDERKEREGTARLLEAAEEMSKPDSDEEEVKRDGNEVNEVESLNLEHTLWSNTVIATGGAVLALVVYTGKETRSQMNASTAKSKFGKVDDELNTMSKILFMMMILLAFALTALKGFVGIWYIYFFRFVLLLSSIIPISMRVNLDMGKLIYAFFIMRDKKIPGTVVRTSTIPEELGRVSYLLSDKTGTLTRNVMTFKTLQMEPPVSFGVESRKLLIECIRSAYGVAPESPSVPPSPSFGKGFDEEVEMGDMSDGNEEKEEKHSVRTGALMKQDRTEALQQLLQHRGTSRKVHETVRALALCHNVTPVHDESGTVYQASSPDEVALVRFTEEIGLKLEERTQKTIGLLTPTGELERYEILSVFPFTSERKRMGIVVRSMETKKITFYLKGAETVLKTLIEHCDWLEEEVDNLARAGLRTLVIASKSLGAEEFAEFHRRLLAAKAVIKNRETQVEAVVRSLETSLTMLGLTGVEDQLQVNEERGRTLNVLKDGVKETLETVRNAGIRVWMLTGDKAETAICIGRSALLIDRNQAVFILAANNTREAARLLDVFSTKTDTCLVINGSSLAMCLANFETQFLDLACQAPAVICCRCSPTQKAQMVTLIKKHKGLRTAAIGDGGNDVNMIQTADVGIGIVGKEGKQASLAADFSINQFSFLSRLLLWHGRNSYMRSARLSLFVIHRGMIISVIQTVFSMLFYFVAIPIYNGWLLVGYATFYTMFPVFSLVLDVDVDEDTVFLFPQLYRDLQKGRPLSMKTFWIWMWISFYQGGVIMIMSMVLFEDNFLNIVAITFTALILSELLNIALEIQTWHWLMVLAELLSIVMYIISVFILHSYFDLTFLFSERFMWRCSFITLTSAFPPAIVKFFWRKLNPPVHAKVIERNSFPLFRL